MMYPDDGGLKEQVRDIKDTLSAFKVIEDAMNAAARERESTAPLAAFSPFNG